MAGSIQLKLELLFDEACLLAGLLEAPAIVVAFAATVFEWFADILILIVIITIQAHATGSSFQRLQALGIYKEETQIVAATRR